MSQTAVSARRVAAQIIQTTIVCAADGLRDQLRGVTLKQLIRTLAARRSDLMAYRGVEAAYRISVRSLARCYLELHDEIADLDAMVGAIVDDLAPKLLQFACMERCHSFRVHNLEHSISRRGIAMETPG